MRRWGCDICDAAKRSMAQLVEITVSAELKITNVAFEYVQIVHVHLADIAHGYWFAAHFVAEIREIGYGERSMSGERRVRRGMLPSSPLIRSVLCSTPQ